MIICGKAAANRNSQYSLAALENLKAGGVVSTLRQRVLIIWAHLGFFKTSFDLLELTAEIGPHRSLMRIAIKAPMRAASEYAPDDDPAE
jgi:hypothetical protein